MSSEDDGAVFQGGMIVFGIICTAISIGFLFGASYGWLCLGVIFLLIGLFGRRF